VCLCVCAHAHARVLSIQFDSYNYNDDHTVIMCATGTSFMVKSLMICTAVCVYQ